MPFRDIQTHFEDILESITHVQAFISDMTYEQFQNDLKTKSAVERQLQIVAEAAYRLGSEANDLCPGPNWKNITGMGNVLRHAYHRVDDAILWKTIKTDLPMLYTSVSQSLAALDG